MTSEIPYVSVIVPMYNTEKYVAEFLNSCLSQTLKNFELIIIDDCSTDKSREIVESYVPEFGGRLNLIESATQEGPGIERNRGLEMSRGKYIFFADSDDALALNALEQMYAIAEKFQAEIVALTKNHVSTGVSEEFLRNLRVEGRGASGNIEIVVGDFPLRVRAWMHEYFGATPWTKFCLRDFLVRNQIKFLPIIQEDSIWTFELVCLA